MKAAVIRYKLVAYRLAQTCLDASLGDASRNTMQVLVCRTRESNGTSSRDCCVYVDSAPPIIYGKLLTLTLTLSY